MFRTLALDFSNWHCPVSEPATLVPPPALLGRCYLVYGVTGLLPPSNEKPVVEKRFIILGYGRTGSTTFRKLLSQHPEVHAYGEVFRKGNGWAAV
jgi:hypothetical protein